MNYPALLTFALGILFLILLFAYTLARTDQNKTEFPRLPRLPRYLRLTGVPGAINNAWRARPRRPTKPHSPACICDLCYTSKQMGRNSMTLMDRITKDYLDRYGPRLATAPQRPTSTYSENTLAAAQGLPPTNEALCPPGQCRFCENVRWDRQRRAHGHFYPACEADWPHKHQSW